MVLIVSGIWFGFGFLFRPFSAALFQEFWSFRTIGASNARKARTRVCKMKRIRFYVPKTAVNIWRLSEYYRQKRERAAEELPANISLTIHAHISIGKSSRTVRTHTIQKRRGKDETFISNLGAKTHKSQMQYTSTGVKRTKRPIHIHIHQTNKEKLRKTHRYLNHTHFHSIIASFVVKNRIE